MPTLLGSEPMRNTDQVPLDSVIKKQILAISHIQEVVDEQDREGELQNMVEDRTEIVALIKEAAMYKHTAQALKVRLKKLMVKKAKRREEQKSEEIPAEEATLATSSTTTVTLQVAKQQLLLANDEVRDLDRILASYGASCG